jgi:hypothetical protein
VGTRSEHNGKIYLKINIKGEMHYVHRLIFWLEKGYLPELVDHEDQNTLNNSIDNLRDISHSHNLLNAKVKSNNISGVTGVRWNKKAKKWVARVSFRRKEYHLGCFGKFEDAVQARQDKVEEFFRNKNTTLFSELE